MKQPLSRRASASRADGGPAVSQAAKKPRQGWRRRGFAAGGLAGALLASSCCIVPVALVLLGASGAWASQLTALAPYQPYFSGAALVFIGLGFWQVYRPSQEPCAVDGTCARKHAAWPVKTTLWLSLILVILALSTGVWAPLFY